MSIYKICSQCGCANFKAQTIRNAIATATVDEEGNLIPSIASEEENPNNLTFLECENGHPIQNLGTDMVDAAPCSECSTLTPVNDLDAAGKCYTCANPRPDLLGLTESQYIRKIVELENMLKMHNATSKSGAGDIEEEVASAIDSGEAI